MTGDDEDGVLDGGAGRWLRVAVAVVAVGLVGAVILHVPEVVKLVASHSPAWLWPLVGWSLLAVAVGLIGLVGVIYALAAIGDQDEDSLVVAALCFLVIVLFLTSGCTQSPRLRMGDAGWRERCAVNSPFVLPDGCATANYNTHSAFVEVDRSSFDAPVRATPGNSMEVKVLPPLLKPYVPRSGDFRGVDNGCDAVIAGGVRVCDNGSKVGWK